MEEIKKKRRSLKEIREDMIKINQRKPSKEELIELVNIINANAKPNVTVDKGSPLKSIG